MSGPCEEASEEDGWFFGDAVRFSIPDPIRRSGKATSETWLGRINDERCTDASCLGLSWSLAGKQSPGPSWNGPL